MVSKVRLWLLFCCDVPIGLVVIVGTSNVLMPYKYRPKIIVSGGVG